MPLLWRSDAKHRTGLEHFASLTRPAGTARRTVEGVGDLNSTDCAIRYRRGLARAEKSILAAVIVVASELAGLPIRPHTVCHVNLRVLLNHQRDVRMVAPLSYGTREIRLPMGLVRLRPSNHADDAMRAARAASRSCLCDPRSTRIYKMRIRIGRSQWPRASAGIS